MLDDKLFELRRRLKSPGSFVWIAPVALGLTVFGVIIVLREEWLSVGAGALVAGFVILAIVFDKNFQKGRVGKEENKSILLVFLLLLSLTVRWVMMPQVNSDIYEIGSWYAYLEGNGYWKAWGDDFSMYPPLFIYLLTFVSGLQIKAVYGIKLLSIVFDYVAGWWVYKIVKLKYGKSEVAWLAALAVLFAPTVLLNSSWWGQSDIIFTSFMLGALYFLLKAGRSRGADNRSVALALILWGVALSIKLLAVFMLLPFVLMYMNKKIRWYQLLLVPLVYVISVLPAWLAGGDLGSLLLFYGRQIERLEQVVITGPTIFQLLPGLPAGGAGEAGYLLVVALTVITAWLIAVWEIPSNQKNLVALAAWSALVIPYLMPGIRERYFFPADLLTILLAFYFPRFWVVPVIVSAISVLSYARFLTGSEVVGFSILSLVMGGVIVWLGRDFFKDWVREGKN